MIRPSPNEFDRLKNEEIAKRRLIRLKEVREYSKINATKLRHLYKVQKNKVINKIAQAIQEQLNGDDRKRIEDLRVKHEYQMSAIGDGHANAADWVDPAIAQGEQSVINHAVAVSRYHQAIADLYDHRLAAKSTETARLQAMQSAMVVEKERAAEIAALPPPSPPPYLDESVTQAADMAPRVKVCDRSKFSVIESYETAAYNVQRMASDDQLFGYDARDAATAGQLRQDHMAQLSAQQRVQAHEQTIKAHLRGHKAIKKQLVHKDYQDLVTDLEQIAKGEMAKRQRDYHKNEMICPNSAGYINAGHNAAMMVFKEKCRERAVEAAVLDSLKDITNCAKHNTTELENKELIPSSIDQRENTPLVSETKLSRLYDKIRQQKEQVRFQDTIVPPAKADTFNRITDRSPSPSSIQSESITTVYSKDIQESEDIIANALLATKRSQNVLEKSSWQKERQNLEQDILKVDRKLANITENIAIGRQMASSTTSRSTTQSNTVEENSNLEICQEVSRSSESVSIVTRESDSLFRIQEFQRKALMKLSGQLNYSQLYTLEREISNFSISSSSVTDRSIVKNLPGVPHPPIERNDCSPEYSQSNISEWVNSQLLQTIDQIPDWVTRSDAQFMPDLNVSFTSSILNIKSEKATTKSDTSSSSMTIGSSRSSRDFRVQPSLTEISAIKKITENELFSDVIEEFDEQVSKLNGTLSMDERLSCRSPRSTKSRDQIDRAHSDVIVGDLLDFGADDSVGTFRDCAPLTKDTDQLLFDDTSSFTQQPIPCLAQEFTGGEVAEKPYAFSHSEYHEGYHKASTNSVNEPKNQSTLKSVNQMHDDYATDNSKMLINDYEQFLNNVFSKKELPKRPNDLCDNESTLNDCYNESLTNFASPMNRSDTDLMRSVSEAKYAKRSQYLSVNSDQSGNMPEVNTKNTFDNPEYVAHLDNTSVTGSPLSNLLNVEINGEDEDYIEDINISKDETIKLDLDNQSQTNTIQDLNKLGLSYIGTPDSVNKSQTISPTSSMDLSPNINGINLDQYTKSNLLSNQCDSHSSLGSLKVLSEYQSIQSNESVETDNKMIPPSSLNSDNEPVIFSDKNPTANIQKILSSTLKPEKRNVLPVSPDVSSIYSDASLLLKQRIMHNYFEKNKERLKTALSNSNSTQLLDLKPLESASEEETPRMPDSGKASSRFTMEQHSGESTARLTNEDIFVTPRNDSCYTYYTSRDEYSTSHSEYQPLSEYVSSKDPYNIGQSSGMTADENDNGLLVDLDATITNIQALEHGPDIDLIVFNSNANLDHLGLWCPGSNRSVREDSTALLVDLESPGIISSQKISTPSQVDSPLHGETSYQDIVFSNESSTECNSSSYRALDSFHSSAISDLDKFTTKQIVDFETGLCRSFEAKDQTDCSMSSKSELDISDLSLVSFLNNEVTCQELAREPSELLCGSTPRKVPVAKTFLDNNDQMRIQLDSWKKQRLMKINSDPPKDKPSKAQVTKDSKMRQKDNVNMKSRTLKLWNNLEEVQKMNQIKEAEKLKIENQLRKKQYSEKIRRIKSEKQKNNTQ